MLVGLFFLAQIIGLGIVNSYVEAKSADGEVEWKSLPSIAGYGLEIPDVAPLLFIVYIVIALAVGTILILLIVRWRSVVLWKLWFWLAVLFCLYIAFGAFLVSWAAFLLALILSSMKILRPSILIHNATELFIYGGLAVFFVRILDVKATVVLLVLISFYDMYAVWRSKHMVKMATFQAKSGIFAGLLLPYSTGKLILTRKQAKKSKVRTAILGGGDIGFPLIFAGVILKSLGLVPAVIIALGASAGLFGLLMYSQKKKFYPAMPFISIGCFVGYAVTFLL